MSPYSITWDVGIVGASALLLAYSLLFHKHKALATLVSVYISYMVTAGWGDRVAAFFTGDRVAFNQMWIKANLSPFNVKAGLLVLLTFLIAAFLKLGGRKVHYSLIEVTIYAICSVLMIVLGMIAFMPPTVLAHALSVSKIVNTLYGSRDWLPLIPVLAMVFFGMYRGED